MNALLMSSVFVRLSGWHQRHYSYAIMNSTSAEGMQPKSILTACKTLLSAHDVTQAISQVLSQVGPAARVDRVYIFSIDGGDVQTASQRFEWSSPNVEPQIDNPDLQDIPLRAAGYGRWIDELSQDRPVVGTVTEFPSEEHQLLEAQDILSLLVLPIHTAHGLWGFVGFDDCTRGRSWTSAEVDALVAMSLALGIVLGEGDQGPLEQTVEAYIRVVGRLFDVHSVMFNETPSVSLEHRAQVRLRIVARAYHYFARVNSRDAVDLSAYLTALQPLYQEVIGHAGPIAPEGLRLEVDSLTLTLQRAFDAALILAEVLAALADRKPAELSGSHLVISVRRRDSSVEMTLTARSASGAPVGKGNALDAIAIAVLREIQERCDATLSGSHIDGLLFRLTLPGAAQISVESD